MSTINQFTPSPPSADDWLRREEEIERSQERRLLALDLAYEYRSENSVDLSEFIGSHAAAILEETGCTPQEIEAFVPRHRLEHLLRSLNFGEAV